MRKQNNIFAVLRTHEYFYINITFKKVSHFFQILLPEYSKVNSVNVVPIHKFACPPCYCCQL